MKYVTDIEQSDLPTFTQFLRYIAKHGQNGMNDHWNSYTRTCNPCIANYAVIGHLETSQMDQRLILESSKLGEFADKVVKQHETKGGPSVNYRDTFFSQVTCDILHVIYELYKLDFDLFGYDPNEHFQLCQE